MRRRGFVRFLITLGCASLCFGSAPGRASDVASMPMYAEPALSPDGSEIAFVSGGDIWTVASVGGTARLLVSFGATESRPLYSPDGTRLAFMSNRAGHNDIYVLTIDGGELHRVTYDDANNLLENWSPDGKSLYFSTGTQNIGYSDIFRVAVAGGTPMPVINEAYANQYGAAPSPDGTTLAFVADGFPQWWRRGHAHIDETSIALYHPATREFDRLSAGAKEQYPMWSSDGRTLYFVSDRSGADNVWSLPIGGKAQRRTTFSAGRIVWPTIARNGHLIAYERDFGIETFDTISGAVHRLTIERRGLPARSSIDHVTLTSRFSGLAVAPDARKLAFVARGQIFAAGSKDGGDAARVTTTSGVDAEPQWSASGNTLVYMSDRAGPTRLYLYDFTKHVEHALTSGAGRDAYPVFTKDGRSVVYQRDGHELRIVDIATGADRLLASAGFTPMPFGSSRDVAMAPAGDAVAFIPTDAHGFANVSIAKLDGSRTTAVSFLPNGNGGSLAFSPDGTRIYFVSGQRTEAGQVVQIDLVPQMRTFREDAFRELFQEVPQRNPVPAPTSAATPAATASPARPAPPHATEIVTDGLRERVEFLDIGLDVTAVSVAPDGKALLLTATAAGQQNLYQFSIDELARDPAVARQITSTSGRKANATFNADGTAVYYLENGRVYVAALDGRTQPRSVSLAAELDVDFDRDKAIMFHQAWSLLNDDYYDASFHGTDWATVRTHYAPFIAGARTPDEVRRALNLMVGELNSSHSGVGAPAPTGTAFVSGHLGVRFDAGHYAQTGRLRVASIIPNGPVAIARAVRVGDDLLAVNGTTIDAARNLDEVLLNTIDKRTVLRIASNGAEHDVAVQPISRPDERRLAYRQWVEANRAAVERKSGGRVGYVHLIDMSEDSLHQFERDLDVQNRAKAAVIVDVRNNNGGFVDPYAIDILARRDYLTFGDRQHPRYSARTSLGQRALLLPTVLLTNEHTLSDSENFTEGYRVLHLGRVVGTPTAGWIIFTSATQLVDGSTLRLPFEKTIAADGTDMELHPRAVDVRVERRLGERLHGEDSQLEAAVREALRARH